MKDTHDKQYLGNLRHSCAHLLAKAVLELWSGSHNAIGPSIENGFYQDFDMGSVKLSDDDLPKIEEKMKKILKTWKRFEYKKVSLEEAEKLFTHNPYKIELAREFAKEGKKLHINNPGNFLDLCKMTHVDNPSEEMQHFKLLSIAGAYWRGDEKREMLTRIYGTCFPTKKALETFLWQQEEAKKRDHKKIGLDLDLFSFHEEGPGFVFWHPNGMRMRQPLIDFWQNLHKRAGYEEVSTPILLKNDVWRKSGHWDNYKDKMYFTKDEHNKFALKPMNCPGMIILYKNRPHSYRELPIKWRELGLVHRFEPSGTLNGLLRERAFRQDDAHIFCKEDQVEQQIKEIITLAFQIYEPFRFGKIQVELSTRPENSIGSDEMWEKSERMLKKVLEELKIDYNLSEGEGAFYGPKIDFHLIDSLGRKWQCGTIQLDFAMPQRFDLTYIDADGRQKRPVMIHRAIFGSVHRFFAILIEHYGGAFPFWLSPVQIVVIPISDKHLSYAQSVYNELITHNLRVELDDRKESMQAKIRDATLQKIPYMGIIGAKEMAGGNVLSVRTREGKDLGQVKVDEFIKKLKDEIAKKK